MKFAELDAAIHAELLGNDLLSDPEQCRYAAGKVKEIFRVIDDQAHIFFLTPKVTTTRDTHYIPVVDTEDGPIAVNTVKTALFPEFIGPLNKAPWGVLNSSLIVVEEII